MGVLTTTDGKKLEGDITEHNDQYVVNIHGVETTFARSDVTNINYTDDYAKEFADRLSKLSATDVPGRIALRETLLAGANMVLQDRRWIRL